MTNRVSWCFLFFPAGSLKSYSSWLHKKKIQKSLALDPKYEGIQGKKTIWYGRSPKRSRASYPISPEQTCTSEEEYLYFLFSHLLHLIHLLAFQNCSLHRHSVCIGAKRTLRFPNPSTAWHQRRSKGSAIVPHAASDRNPMPAGAFPSWTHMRLPTSVSRQQKDLTLLVGCALLQKWATVKNQTNHPVGVNQSGKE